MRYLALLVMSCLLCGACGAGGPGGPTSTGMGLQVFPVSERTFVPPLSGTTITGGSLDLADEVGHGLVAVNVWASWCGPCRKELPVLAHAAGSGLRVIGIDERDRDHSARSFATSRGVTYPSLSDPQGKLLAALPMLPQTGVPSTLFLDRRGRVAARVIGPVDAHVLRRIIRQLGASS